MSPIPTLLMHIHVNAPGESATPRRRSAPVILNLQVTNRLPCASAELCSNGSMRNFSWELSGYL